MESAKNAISDFMAKSGHHDTTVHEKVAPAVVHETINRERREEIQTAIDKEVHQDHYHTSIQPVKDREVLPEQHHHNLGAVEHRKFEHGNDREVAERLKVEAAQFRNERIEGTERHTQSVAPTLAGEHIHHHVHETIQPVIEKETIEPHVVHTVVPIHEVHHNAAQHHSASALPAVSMADFKKQGGVLTGREERYDGFAGEPKSVGGHSHSHTGTSSTHSGGLKEAVGAATGSSTHTSHSTTGTGLGHSSTGHSTTGTGLGHSSTGTGLGHSSTGTGLGHSTSGHSSSGLGHSSTGTGVGAVGSRDGKFGTTDSHSTSSSTRDATNTKTKPSLLDKLNPMKDSDHDGKKGFME